MLSIAKCVWGLAFGCIHEINMQISCVCFLGKIIQAPESFIPLPRDGQALCFSKKLLEGACRQPDWDSVTHSHPRCAGDGRFMEGLEDDMDTCGPLVPALP